VPGMIGRVGTACGREGVNIISAAVGRQPDKGGAGNGGIATMAITTDSPMPKKVIDEIVASDGFAAGRTVSL
jgi:hypothetical protein